MQPIAYPLLKRVQILPVTTSPVERCFSAINIVKIVLRNKIGEEFMGDYLISFVEKDMYSTITKDVVIDHFKKVKDRKGEL